MSYSRRYVLMTASSSLASVALPAAAQPQFPARPVQLVVPYPAGGTTDVLTRAIAQQLAEAWGKPVIIENKGEQARVSVPRWSRRPHLTATPFWQPRKRRSW